MPDSIVVEHLAVGPLQCNCTIVADVAAGEAIVVDGGDEVERIVARLDALGVRATALVHTHAHFDHIGALADLKERTGGAGLLHPGDLPLFNALALQARFFGVPAPRPVALDGDLADGDTIRAGAVSLSVLHTPGHTPGSTCFALERGTGTARSTTLLTGGYALRGCRRALGHRRHLARGHRHEHPHQTLGLRRRQRRRSRPRSQHDDRHRTPREPLPHPLSPPCHAELVEAQPQYGRRHVMSRRRFDCAPAGASLSVTERLRSA